MKARIWIPFAAVLLMAGAVAAQGSPAQGSWTAWHGCWTALQGDVPAGPIICMLPGEDTLSVRIATLGDGAVQEETVLRAEGVARPVEAGGCTGSERAFFSNDGLRVFTRAELACAGIRRVSTGVLALVSEMDWLDVQAMTVEGRHAVRSVRYRAVGAEAAEAVPAEIAAALPQNQRLAQEAARLHASAPLDISAVAEASRIVAAPAVETLLAARGQSFDLDAHTLLALKEQGVPASTIDIMVALSYPARFTVREVGGIAQTGETMPAAWRSGGSALAEDCYDPYWSSRRYRGAANCYDYGYGYDRRYGYSPWGYGPFGWTSGGSPVIVIVQPDQTRAGGEVVKGRGYTRTGGPTRGTATPRTPARGADTGSTTSASGNSGTARSSEPKNDASSGTGRTAKPRGARP